MIYIQIWFAISIAAIIALGLIAVWDIWQPTGFEMTDLIQGLLIAITPVAQIGIFYLFICVLITEFLPWARWKIKQ